MEVEQLSLGWKTLRTKKTVQKWASSFLLRVKEIVSCGIGRILTRFSSDGEDDWEAVKCQRLGVPKLDSGTGHVIE